MEDRTDHGRGALRSGAVAMAPIVVGLAPFALTVGAAAGATGPWLPRWLATFAFYGGTTQLAVLRLLDSGAGLGVVVLTGVLTQCRLLVYSSAMAPHWAHERRSFTAWAAGVLVEPTWSLGLARFASLPSDDLPARAAARRYYLGAVLVLTFGWGGLVTVGMVSGRSTGSGLLALAVPLSLTSSVVPQVTDRVAVRVLVTSVVVASVTAGMPAGTGLVVAIVCGVAVGVVGSDSSADAAASRWEASQQEVGR